MTERVRKAREEARKNVDLITRVGSRMCDDYCRFPSLAKDEEALEKACERCPLNDLLWKVQS